MTMDKANFLTGNYYSLDIPNEKMLRNVSVSLQLWIIGYIIVLKRG